MTLRDSGHSKEKPKVRTVRLGIERGSAQEVQHLVLIWRDKCIRRGVVVVRRTQLQVV